MRPATTAPVRSPLDERTIVALVGRLFAYQETEALFRGFSEIVRNNDGVDDAGNPNGEGLATWPAYDRKTDTWMVFSDTDRASAGLIHAKLDLIESRYRQRIGTP